MDYKIRPLKKSERALVKEFTYQAIFLREEKMVLPRDVLDRPELAIFYEDFGKPTDTCLVAEVDGRVVGAVWTRILSGPVRGFGNLDDKTPEFGISLFKEYRGHGLGTALLEQMLDLLRQQGVPKVSLAVQKDNFALRMYQKLGFTILRELEEEYLMICVLNP